MTPQEQQLLMQLTQRINQTQLQEKDPDAENLLGHELGGNPDAIYILAQTVLVQNIALDQAKAQIMQLQQQSRQPAHTTSFLGRLLGDRDPEPASPQPSQTQQGQFQQAQYQPVPQYAQTPPQYAPVPPQYGQPQYQQPQYVPAQGGQPSFLRGAMQTAAGVAAGALAFEGVESILHGIGGGHGGYGWGGPGMMGGMGGMGGGSERPVEETVNNYYDGAGGGDNLRGFESGDPHSHEPADRMAGDNADNTYDAVTGDNSADSLAGLDDGSSSDTSGFDGGGQDDGGGGFDDGGGDSGGGDSL